MKLTFAPYITEVMNVRICTFIFPHGFMAWFFKHRDKFPSSFFYTELELFQNIRELCGNNDIVRKREAVTGRWRKLYIEVFRNLFSKNIIEIIKSRRVSWAGRMTFWK